MIDSKTALEKATKADEAANILNNQKHTNLPIEVKGAINVITEALAIILKYLQEQESIKNSSTDSVIDRNEELSEEVDRLNKEDINSSS